MQIRQFKFASDNLGYLIYGPATAMAVDGGATDEILSFVQGRQLRLQWVTNTHNHPDHTAGNASLLAQSKAVYLDYQHAARKGAIELDGEPITVYATPGHTLDSVCFSFGNVLVTGDTLFNGTVGNCFSDDLTSFYHSIRKIMDLPAETIIYAGHDYVTYAMAFARKLEPDNRAIDHYLAQYDPTHVCSRLGQELQVNPYLRFNQPPLVALMQRQGLAVNTELERWESVMTLD